MFSILDSEPVNLDISMNVDYETRRGAHAEDPATVSLIEAPRNEIGQAFKWRRIDPSLNTAVSPLLQRPVVPFHKTEKAKAYKSAIYYSECFLRGITPNDADSAASQINSHYQKWWVKSTFQDGKSTREDANPIPRHDDLSISSLKRKYMTPSVNNKLCSMKRPRQGDSSNDMANTAIQVKEQNPTRESAVGAETAGLDAVENSQHPPIGSFAVQVIPNLSSVRLEQIEGIREDTIMKLRENGGDVTDPIVRNYLSILESYYLTTDIDARLADDEDFPYHTDGTWLTLSKPTYSESKGKNQSGESMYSLGRMSFDMFRPTNLLCSIQGIYNTVQLLDPAKGELPYSMPRRIRKELGKSLLEGVKGLRTYNIVVAMTIEPNQCRSGKPASESNPQDVISKPIRGIITNFGYLLPDPNYANRVSIWFTGGSLEVNDEQEDLGEWKKIFGRNAPNRSISEFARVLAAKVLLGAAIPDEMEENGTLSYSLKRPIGGHGTAFCDVLYMDDKLRVLRGHGGSVFVFVRCQASDD